MKRQVLLTTLASLLVLLLVARFNLLLEVICIDSSCKSRVLHQVSCVSCFLLGRRSCILVALILVIVIYIIVIV